MNVTCVTWAGNHHQILIQLSIVSHPGVQETAHNIDGCNTGASAMELLQSRAKPFI